MELEDNFLDNGGEPENSPDEKYIGGTSIQSVLNDKSAVQIGKSIFVILPDFDVAEITDANFQTYLKIVSGQSLNLANVVIYPSGAKGDANGTLGSDCKQFFTKSITQQYAGGTRNLKTSTTMVNLPLISWISTTSDNYRKKNNWKWTHDNAQQINAGAKGLVYSRDCSQNGLIGTQNIKYNKKTVTKTFFYAGQNIRYQPTNSLFGTGYAKDNGGSMTISITYN
jgi:hypothetical protein